MEIENDEQALEALMKLIVHPAFLLTTGEIYEIKYELERYFKWKKL